MDNGETKRKRSGRRTGFDIAVLLMEHKSKTAGALAAALNMEESYIRRVCRDLAREGRLHTQRLKQRGTPSVVVYSLACAEE